MSALFALDMAENDPSGICDKIFNQLKLVTLNQENGIADLTEQMNNLFFKDKISDIYVLIMLKQRTLY